MNQHPNNEGPAGRNWTRHVARKYGHAKIKPKDDYAAIEFLETPLEEGPIGEILGGDIIDGVKYFQIMRISPHPADGPSVFIPASNFFDYFNVNAKQGGGRSRKRKSRRGR